MAFSSAQLEFYPEVARQKVEDNFDVQGFLETYAAMPEYAGQELQHLLQSLPRNDTSPDLDAFIALAIARKTHDCLVTIVKEGQHMDKMLAEATGKDVDIRDSLKGGDTLSGDLQKYLEEQGRDAQQNVDREINQESRARDEEVTQSFQEGFNQGAEPLDAEFDYRSYDPKSCYHRSTHDMGAGIVSAVLRPGRLNPLYANGIITPEKIVMICTAIKKFINKLRYKDGGDQATAQD